MKNEKLYSVTTVSGTFRTRKTEVMTAEEAKRVSMLPGVHSVTMVEHEGGQVTDSSKRLQEWMRAAGLNQQQAAEVFGVKKRCLQYWLHGRQLPGPATQLLSVLESHPMIQSFLLSSHTSETP